MNEGEKAQFQRLTNRDIKVDRKTSIASFRPDPAQDRHALIMASVVDWSLVTRKPTGGWERLAFNRTMLGNWLQVTNPQLVEDLEDAIRKANPWLSLDEDTIEELERQLQEITDRLAAKRASEAGKESSETKPEH
jgi:uncharacterized coiled-coil protein SlyX